MNDDAKIETIEEELARTEAVRLADAANARPVLVVRDGVVENLIKASPAFCEAHRDGLFRGALLIETSLEPGAPGVGWTYDGKEFARPAPAESPVPLADRVAELEAAIAEMKTAAAEAKPKEITK